MVGLMETEEKRKQLFKELIEIVGELGWVVAIPEGDLDEEVPGLVVGTEEYVNHVIDAVDENYSGSHKETH
jgi:hypothetical protein